MSLREERVRVAKVNEKNRAECDRLLVEYGRSEEQLDTMMRDGKMDMARALRARMDSLLEHVERLFEIAYRCV